jgi:single stranded DNA-binding protein
MQTNRFEVTGYLAAKPESRTLPSGTPVANARLGQSYTYDSKDGTQKHTNWFGLAFYGDLATSAVGFEKGDKLNIIGALEQRQFTPKDKSTRTIYEVVVRECRLVAHSRTVAELAPEDVPGDASPNNAPVKPMPAGDEKDAWAVL